MRILVTGSSGRLGQRVVGVAREMGHDVVPVDMRPPAEDDRGDTRIADLCNFEGLPKLFEGIDAVCHLGNLPGFGEVGRSRGYLNNTATNYNVFLAADQAGVRRVVYASSIQSYGCMGGASGPPKPDRISAPLYLPLDEDHPLQPVEAYPLSKATGEWIGEGFCRQQADRTAWSLRFTSIRTGPRPRRVRPPDWRPWLLASFFSWIHVDDAARATVLAAQAERFGHTPLNIVAPTSLRPWSEQALIDVYGHLPPFRRPLACDEALVSGERAQAVLGFYPQRTPKDLEAPLLSSNGEAMAQV